MKIDLTGRHIEVTPALRAFVDQHLEKASRVLPGATSIHVILTVEKKRHLCEVILKSKKTKLTCVESTGDMYASITRAAHKFEKQVLKATKRNVEVKRRKLGSKATEPPLLAQGVEGPSVIEETVPKKPMAIEEALLNLGDSRKGFIVYRDVDSKGVSVVYRRKDGNIGWIRA